MKEESCKSKKRICLRHARQIVCFEIVEEVAKYKQ